MRERCSKAHAFDDVVDDLLVRGKSRHKFEKLQAKVTQWCVQTAAQGQCYLEQIGFVKAAAGWGGMSGCGGANTRKTQRDVGCERAH